MCWAQRSSRGNSLCEALEAGKVIVARGVMEDSHVRMTEPCLRLRGFILRIVGSH